MRRLGSSGVFELFIDMQGEQKVVLWNGPVDWTKKEGRRVNLEDARRALTVLGFSTPDAERAIRQSPAEYGSWLLHCRLRNNIDDHPLFLDHAVDDRWRKWVPE